MHGTLFVPDPFHNVLPILPKIRQILKNLTLSKYSKENFDEYIKN
jgi:hypothetical protein